MSYQLYCLKMQPQSAFVTPLVADTLFGHVCWSIRHQYGEKKLEELLKGYTENQPFIVVGQPFPKDKLPHPNLPLEMLGFDLSDATRRKAIKKQKWIDAQSEVLNKPCRQWGEFASALPNFVKDDHESEQMIDWSIENSRMHNSLSRITGSTGNAELGFAPFQRKLTWFHPHVIFDCYIVVDNSRFSLEEMTSIFEKIGAFGYGKEASSGLGKFSVIAVDQIHPIYSDQHNAYLTLGACIPQGDLWDHEHSFYATTVKFGRHGAEAIYIGSPFKNPVLMAEVGSIFSPKFMTPRLFIGKGVSGVSKTITKTVHQGYAPVLTVQIERGTI